jgi:DNA-binding FadR family transcriptional regulator
MSATHPTFERIIAAVDALRAQHNDRTPSQREIAERMGVSQSFVSQTLQRARRAQVAELAEMPRAPTKGRRRGGPTFYEKRRRADHKPRLSPRVVFGLEALLASTVETDATREAVLYLRWLLEWHERGRRKPARDKRGEQRPTLRGTAGAR